MGCVVFIKLPKKWAGITSSALSAADEVKVKSIK
jgi:hypothetical protein